MVEAAAPSGRANLLADIRNGTALRKTGELAKQAQGAAGEVSQRVTAAVVSRNCMAGALTL